MAPRQGGQIVVGGLHTGFGGSGIGLGGAEIGLLRFDCGGGLGVLDLGQQLALADAVALLHQQPGDFTHGVGTDMM